MDQFPTATHVTGFNTLFFQRIQTRRTLVNFSNISVMSGSCSPMCSYSENKLPVTTVSKQTVSMVKLQVNYCLNTTECRKYLSLLIKLTPHAYLPSSIIDLNLHLTAQLNLLFKHRHLKRSKGKILMSRVFPTPFFPRNRDSSRVHYFHISIIYFCKQ